MTWLFITKENSIIYEENGRVLAEVCFPEGEGGAAAITRTFCRRGSARTGYGRPADAARGRASARQRQKGRAVCSYAAAWFKKHPEYADVLAEA